MKIGTLLVPNDYLIANGKLIFGLIIESKDDLWGQSYKIFLSNGNTQWKDKGTILDLWEVMEP